MGMVALKRARDDPHIQGQSFLEALSRLRNEYATKEAISSTAIENLKGVQAVLDKSQGASRELHRKYARLLWVSSRSCGHGRRFHAPSDPLSSTGAYNAIHDVCMQRAKAER